MANKHLKKQEQNISNSLDGLGDGIFGFASGMIRTGVDMAVEEIKEALFGNPEDKDED